MKPEISNNKNLTDFKAALPGVWMIGLIGAFRLLYKVALFLYPKRNTPRRNDWFNLGFNMFAAVLAIIISMFVFKDQD